MQDLWRMPKFDMGVPITLINIGKLMDGRCPLYSNFCIPGMDVVSD